MTPPAGQKTRPDGGRTSEADGDGEGGGRRKRSFNEAAHKLGYWPTSRSSSVAARMASLVRGPPLGLQLAGAAKAPGCTVSRGRIQTDAHRTAISSVSRAHTTQRPGLLPARR